MDISLWVGKGFLTGLKPGLWTFRVRVINPFFIPSDDSVQKFFSLRLLEQDATNFLASWKGIICKFIGKLMAELLDHSQVF